MYTGKTLFAQLMDFLPVDDFFADCSRDTTAITACARCRVTEHFRVMAFAQLTYRESLRDIEACCRRKLPSSTTWASASPVRRATLADASERRGLAHLRGVRTTPHATQRAPF